MNFADGGALYGPQMNAILAAFRGTALLSGCVASASGGNRTISVTAGSVMINDSARTYAGGSVMLDAGGTFDRYDLITISTAGVLAATKGTEAKKCPPQPANTCLLAIVFVPAGATVIATGNVIDSSVPIMRCVPPGTICMWSGSIVSIPAGWALCNGSNGTPDLRDKFVVGAGSGYAVGATGGEATHVLTIDEMPSHSHNIRAGNELGQDPWAGVKWVFGQKDVYQSTESAGGGQAHNNLPPYYALAYIMKLP